MMRKPMRPAMRPEMRPDMRPPMRPELRPLTDEEGEVRELTAEDFEHMRPLAEVDPDMIEAMEALRECKKGGRPQSKTPKVRIGFRLSADLVRRIRASGAGYNARVEAALLKAFRKRA